MSHRFGTGKIVGDPRAASRRGVILLVVMALLALFTLMGLTLVLATAQARLSALAAARAQSSATPDTQLLSRAFHDLVRGTTNPRSPIQGHSVLEDLYGSPLFIGRVLGASYGSSGNTGQLLQLTYTTLAGAASNPPYLLPNANYVYTGLVMTMLDGPAQNRSARIVADRLGGGAWYLYTTTFESLQATEGQGVLPASGDSFVINGRPFTGTGFGFQFASFTTPGNPIYNVGAGPVVTYKLDAMDPTPYSSYLLGAGGTLSVKAPQFLWPYALLPNHAQFTPQIPPAVGGTPLYQNGMGYYTDPGGPGVANAASYVAPGANAATGGANEPYDAVDYQNMHLAMHYFDSNVLATLPPTLKHPPVLTPEPSFHRPALFAYWSQHFGALQTASPTLYRELRRKIMLRPDPEDQAFVPFSSQDLNMNGKFDFREPFTDMNGDGVWTPGEPWLELNNNIVYDPGDLDFTGKPFNPVTGPYCIYHDPTTNLETWVLESRALNAPVGDWDVDNDNDGYNDSVWLDLGYDPEKGPDGRLYKPLFAFLCVDMDGKLNVNAHGNIAHIDPLRYNASVTAPVLGSAGASGTLATNGTSRNFTFGEGFGPAEVSLLPLLARNGPGSVNTNPLATLQYYQQLLQGTYLPSMNNQPPRYVHGRNGEADDPYLQLAPGAVNPTVQSGPNTLSLLGGPMPGRTMQFDPNTTIVNDALNQVRQFLEHPWLVLPAANQPPISPVNSRGIFFDFVNANLTPTAYTHVPTGYGSAYNLSGRGSVLLDLRGQPYYAGTTNFPWMTAVTATYPAGSISVADTVDDPYELDLFAAAQRDGMIVNAAGNISKQDAPFTPEELERVVRSFDVDAQSLPSRLNDLLPLVPGTYAPADISLALGLPTHNQALTTHSNDLPVPGVTGTHPSQITDYTTSAYSVSTYNSASMSLGGASVIDLARARIMKCNPGWSAPMADVALFGTMALAMGNNTVQPLFAPELVQGMRIDINRTVGNGTDDNANGVVDEASEVPIIPGYGGETLNFPLNGGAYAAISLDLNNDGILPSAASDPGFFQDARSRQLLARHLYVTMMLLIEDLNLQVQIFQTTSAQSYGALTTASTGNQPAQQLAYLVAQWAINVVDFRDPDSIMTPFEFDLSPFTDDNSNPADGTWDVDDIVYPSNAAKLDPWTMQTLPPMWPNDDTSTWRGLVWGCERPELLITETMATHDRGTADTADAANLPSGNADTKYTPTDPMADQDFDQVRRPRGSIIVELFNPNSPLSAPQADMLQQTTIPVPSTGGVNLTQYTIGPAGISPVWRLAVAYSPGGYDNNYITTAPTAYQLDTRVPFIPPANIHRVAYFTPLDPKTGGLAVSEVPAWSTFYPDQSILPLGTPVVVPPNSYALIGPANVDPRPNTKMPGIAALFFGTRNIGSDSTAGPDGKQNLYSKYLELNPPSAALYNNSAAGPTGGIGVGVPPFVTTPPQVNVKNVVALPLATLYLNGPSTAPVAQTAATTSLRFSISEPEGGYPIGCAVGPNPKATTLNQNILNMTLPYPYWDDGFYFLSGAGAPAAKYPNTPFDVPDSTNSKNANAVGVIPNPYVTPDGTTLQYTNIYLQRLANPLSPWDLTANPYIIVDSMPLDLTAYSGESPAGGEPAYTGSTGNGTAGFDARSRGEIYGTNALDAPNIWTPSSTAPSSWAVQSTAAMPLQYSTFGFLNQTYWMNATLPTGNFTGNKSNIGFPTQWVNGFYSPSLTAAMDANAYNRLNNGTTNSVSGASATGIAPAQYYGDPLLPFPWLVWNNRPYISQFELMLVPASSPSSLLSDFGLLGYVRNSYQTATGQTTDLTSPWTVYNTAYSPYNPTAGKNPVSQTGTVATLAVPLGPFQQLLNFYDSTLPIAGGVTRNASSTQPGNFFRIFEYLSVPSPYTGTQKLLNPAAMSGVVSGLHWLHPPFNWISQYREPGRVNLNTVFDPVVFQGVMDDFPQWTYGAGASPSASWQKLWQGIVDSRRGYNGIAYDSMTGVYSAAATGSYSSAALPNFSMFNNSTVPQPILPTYTANPLRPEGAATLVPPVNSVAWPLANLGQLAGQEINSTMLRPTAPNSYVGAATAAGTAVAPLFSAAGFDAQATADSYVANTGNAPWKQTARNPYFQYQAQQRLGNLVTNRSNVFAIWVTVGYFEALPVLPSAANPDGFQLGAERGSDSGTVDRHRAFYMFDRSIPMGFQRGEDLNVDNGIITRRVIE